MTLVVTAAPPRLRDHRAQIAILAIVFLATRIAAHFAGLHFDTDELRTYWQFLDSDLLRHDLLRSLLYLHAQPPLMNAFIGVMLKLFPSHWPLVTYLLYCTLGFCAWLALFSIALRNRVPSTLAFLFVLLAMGNPSALYFEAQPLYTHVVFCLLVFAAFFFDRFLETRNTLSAISTLITLMVLVLWRSSFQPVWFGLLAIWIVYLASKDSRRSIRSAAIVCFLLVCSVVLKNGVLMGSFNTGSWLGMSVAKAWTWSVHPEIPPLVAQGKLSPISAIQSYRPTAEYAAIVPPHKPTGIEVLDAPYHHDMGVNYNNINYIAISKTYFRDYFRVWRYSPRTMVAFSIQAWLDYLKPASQWVAIHDLPNESTLEPVDRVYRLIFCCRTQDVLSVINPADSFRQRLGHALRSLCWPSVALVAFIFAALLLPRLIRWTADGSPRTRLLLYFCCVTVAYQSLVSNMLEEGENMRFRYESHGLALIVAIILLSRCLPRKLEDSLTR